MSRRIGILGFLLALCAAAPLRAAEDFSTWAHSAKLRLNTTASGANVPRNITNFGLLVRITDARILTQSMETGADVRFADAKGAPLDFQIERWTRTAAEFWVRIPQIDSLSDKQYLNVYWGKPGSPWLSDPNKTFTRDPAYLMVYHMGEGATQSRTNSVGNWNHAQPVNFDGDERVPGLIGMADSLDGSSIGGDHLNLGAGFTDLTRFAVTLWAKPARAGSWERFLDFGNGENNENLTFTRANASDSLSAHGFGTPTPATRWQGAGFTDLGYVNAKGLETGKWAFYGLSINERSVTIYKNGVKLAGGEFRSMLNKVLRTRNWLGHSNWPYDRDFNGVMDEVQFSSAPHSAEWFKLTYESQRPDSRMFAWEFAPDVKLAIATQPSGATVDEGKPFKLAVIAAATGSIAYQWSKDGTAIPGATASAYAVAAATLEHSGVYTCRLTDGKDTLVTKPAAVLVPEDLSTWSHSQKVFINTAAGGADLSAEVSNIPILVRLGKKNLDFSQVGEGGRDLRFADNGGAALSHAIERWGTDTAEVWVRMPKVAHNASVPFTMYWGKLAARQGSAPGSVFSLNDNWRLYYDFNDSPSGSGDSYAKDATLNGWRGQGKNVFSTPDGAIGKALIFDGKSQMESPFEAVGGIKAFTIMAWVREKAYREDGLWLENPHLFGVRRSEASPGEFGVYSRTGALHYWHGLRANSLITYHPQAFPLTDKAWHLVTLTYSGTHLTLYADGIALHSDPSENVPLPTGNALSIGALRGSTGTWGGFFTGDIDAVQMTGDAKDKEWIKLAHAVQKPASTVITFGAPADLAPPAPAINPPAGTYQEAIQVQLSCAADSARIFYTLDGSEPDTVVRASTRSAAGPIRVESTITVKAKAYWKGKASPVASANYSIAAVAVPGDTLRPGGSMNVDPGHTVVFPHQDSKGPVRLTAGPAWNPAPAGFERVGPLFVLSAVDTAAAFPGLRVEGDSLAGLSLFRRENGLNHWMAPKDDQLWIPAPGSYFWARDTLPPRIRFTGSSARGDSLMAWIAIDDNVSTVQGKARFGADSLGWWSVAAGEILEFTIPAPADPGKPLEARFLASDHSRSAIHPAGRALTLPRPVPPMSVPTNLKPYQWKMAGMPMLADGEVSLSDLANMSGTGPLFAAVWRNAKPDTGYLILQGDDKLPAGKGFWLASKGAAPTLNLPASRALASDSDGLFTLNLSGGWNLVTCPSFRPLAWPVSVKDGDAWLKSPLKPLHGLSDSGYARPDSLRPWEAYYVYYDKDTVVRVGDGAPKVTDKLPSPKASAPSRNAFSLSLSGPGGLLSLGASPFARPGLGREDESRPPPVDARAAAWLARDGHALISDFTAWDPDRALSFTAIARGQATGAAFAVGDATLPPGYEAWAVSPSRRLKWRLLPGSSIPVTGEDTLMVYAGTPAALAKVGALLRGRAAAGAFAARLRSAHGGLELILELPSEATLSLVVHDARGRKVGGLGHRPLAAGRHALSLGRLPQGAYIATLEAKGPDWTRRQVHPITLLH